VEAVGEDNVGIHLDTFHMYIEEADAAAAIRACGSALRHFHVNENHRGYLNAGSIGFAPIFRALVTAQYARARTARDLFGKVVASGGNTRHEMIANGARSRGRLSRQCERPARAGLLIFAAALKSLRVAPSFVDWAL
jgi:xylose isomerase-like TIM barrel protein